LNTPIFTAIGIIFSNPDVKDVIHALSLNEISKIIKIGSDSELLMLRRSRREGTEVRDTCPAEVKIYSQKRVLFL
jgi:hypothetical protein